MTTQVKSQHLEESAKRATAWLASELTEKGNYRGKEQPTADGTYPDTDDIGCYYKSIYSLRATGQSAAAAKCLSYVVSVSGRLRVIITIRLLYAVQAATARISANYTRMHG